MPVSYPLSPLLDAHIPCNPSPFGIFLVHNCQYLQIYISSKLWVYVSRRVTRMLTKLNVFWGRRVKKDHIIIEILID